MNSMMKVIWHDQAKDALRKTAAYIRKHFGFQVRENFRNEIDKVQVLLTSNPYMGLKEPLLEDQPVEYRSFIINRLNKIVYYIEGDIIHIADFWDTRREPKAQAEQLKKKL